MPRCEATIHTAPVSPSSTYLHAYSCLEMLARNTLIIVSSISTFPPADTRLHRLKGFGRIRAEVRLFSSKWYSQVCNLVISAKEILLHCHPIQPCFLTIPREGWSLPQRQEYTLEYLEKTHTSTGGTCKLHIERQELAIQCAEQCTAAA